jgi:hypothetical protein
MEPQRLQMINVSSAMAGQFAFAAAEFSAEIQRLGPNPLHSDRRPVEEENRSQVEEESAQVTNGSSG